MGSVVADMQELASTKNVKLMAGQTVGWSGEFENQERAMKRLAVVVPISLLLIFVLLFDAFRLVQTSYAHLALTCHWRWWVVSSHCGSSRFRCRYPPRSVSSRCQVRQSQWCGDASVFQQYEASGMSVADAVRQRLNGSLRTVLMTAMLAEARAAADGAFHDIGAGRSTALAIVVLVLFAATLLTLSLCRHFTLPGSRGKSADSFDDIGETAPATVGATVH